MYQAPKGWLNEAWLSLSQLVVAFNLGPHPEVIKDKATGLLIPPADTASFAEAIVKLLKDTKLRQEMGEKAYKAVRERFSTYEGVVAK